MDEKTLHLIVKGSVQGVGFRWFVVDAARRLDLAGWVKNRDDGAVEIAASGRSDALTRLELAVKDGPRGAHVADVVRSEAKSLAPLERPFTISR